MNLMYDFVKWYGWFKIGQFLLQKIWTEISQSF